MKMYLFIFTAILLSVTYANAHVFGKDSRTIGDNFPVSENYYNSVYQAELAKQNLVHVECTKNRKWDQNSTSGFLIDVVDYAKRKKINGNFETCNSRVLLSVAHYIEDRDNASDRSCTIYQSFETNLGKSSYGKATGDLSLGSFEFKKQGRYIYQDFVIIEIDPLSNDEHPNRDNIKICPKSMEGKSETNNNLILPHLSRYENDKWALQKNLKIKAKISSGKCSGLPTKFSGVVMHNCDMDKRASGSPLLSIGTVSYTHLTLPTICSV